MAGDPYSFRSETFPTDRSLCVFSAGLFFCITASAENVSLLRGTEITLLLWASQWQLCSPEARYSMWLSLWLLCRPNALAVLFSSLSFVQWQSDISISPSWGEPIEKAADETGRTNGEKFALVWLILMLVLDTFYATHLSEKNVQMCGYVL